MKGIKEGQAVYWTDPYTHERNVYSVLIVPPQDSEDNIIIIGNPWTEKIEYTWESDPKMWVDAMYFGKNYERFQNKRSKIQHHESK